MMAQNNHVCDLESFALEKRVWSRVHLEHNFSLLGRGLPAVVVDQQRLKGLDEVLQATREVGVLNLVCVENVWTFIMSLFSSK